MGKQLGDKYPYEDALARAKLENRMGNEHFGTAGEQPDEDGPGGRLYGSDYEYHKNMAKLSKNNQTIYNKGEDDGDDKGGPFDHESHPWGIFFTVLGTVLLDFDADACQSPSRAYLLDVTVSGKLCCIA